LKGSTTGGIASLCIALLCLASLRLAWPLLAAPKLGHVHTHAGQQQEASASEPSADRVCRIALVSGGVREVVLAAAV